MATKVEELRDRIQVAHWNGAPQGVPFVEITGLLDSLIAAARAEGAAEERKRIRASADLVREGHYADASAYFSKVMGKGEKWEVVADEDCFVIPVSALAPKEG